MKIISSLPDFDKFKELLENRTQEVHDGFDKSAPIISLNTYMDALETYSEEDRVWIHNYVSDNNISIENPFTGGDKWSRFEEYHTPSIFTETDKKPFRKTATSNVYWVKAVKDIKLSKFHGNYLRIFTGYKLIIPKDCIALVGTNIDGISVLNAVIPAMSLLKGEFFVDVVHTTEALTTISKGETYLYVAIIKAETLMSDNVFNEEKLLTD